MAVRRTRAAVAAVVTAAVVLGAGVVAVAADDVDDEELTGYEEVPALSTRGGGEFRADIRRNRSEIRYELSFGNLESPVTQSHLHFENRTENGPIVVFLCSNLGNGPAGTQACPAGGGEISGTIRPGDVLGNAADRGLAAGEFDELVRAIRAGAIYVNVHTTGRPGGEIRAQLDDHDHDDH
jgi:CHRD domain